MHVTKCGSTGSVIDSSQIEDEDATIVSTNGKRLRRRHWWRDRFGHTKRVTAISRIRAPPETALLPSVCGAPPPARRLLAAASTLGSSALLLRLPHSCVSCPADAAVASAAATAAARLAARRPASWVAALPAWDVATGWRAVRGGGGGVGGGGDDAAARAAVRRARAAWDLVCGLTGGHNNGSGCMLCPAAPLSGPPRLGREPTGWGPPDPPLYGPCRHARGGRQWCTFPRWGAACPPPPRCVMTCAAETCGRPKGHRAGLSVWPSPPRQTAPRQRL